MNIEPEGHTAEYWVEAQEQGEQAIARLRRANLDLLDKQQLVDENVALLEQIVEQAAIVQDLDNDHGFLVSY